MTLEDRVKEIIETQLGVDPREITPGAHLVNDLQTDSLDSVELLMAIEEKFDLDISDEDAEAIRTVKDISDYLRERGCK
jgi:acyl carrier protein